ncbi:MAG TPA: hypothetical protein VF407_18020 [Polyangiaceae bacterium]
MSQRLRAAAPPPAFALHVGKLLEIRITTPIRNPHDIVELGTQFRAAASKTEGNVVIASDYRQASLLSPERAEEFRALMATLGPRITRSAIVLDKDKATFNLQLQRVVLRAGSSDRKMFFDVGEAKAFLAPALDDAERARLDQFFAGN